MELLILATRWGFEHLAFEDFIIKIKEAGFNGIDAWLPEQAGERRKFIKLLDEYKIPVVCHQHQASGSNINAFCKSFEYYLEMCLEANPLLINSHSGKDYFPLNDQLRVIDVANNFAEKNNVIIAHETHRGRLGFSPYNAKQLFDLRPGMKITADLSHWVCVTESYLDNSVDIVDEAIKRTAHLHARVGYTESPQVPDPRTAEWKEATDIFMNWWMRIINHQQKTGATRFTLTPEFGQPPYMPTNPVTALPVTDQFELNCFIKDLVRERYNSVQHH